MADHRRSYAKTVAAALVAAAGSLAAAAALGVMAWTEPGWSATAWVTWSVLTALTLLAAVAWTMVAAGGRLALHRDALEARGVPYAPARPREATPGFGRRGLRAFGRGLRALTGRAPRLALMPGDEVEVRGLDEILATLDERGMLHALPFMPEMAAYCGRRFRVFRRVDKLNDWVGRTGLRRVHDTVLLEGLTCSGAAHGGCQAACYLRWHEAWLQRPAAASAATPAPARARLTEADLARLAERRGEDGTPRWICQVTELGRGTARISGANPRHYLRDLATGNIRLAPLLEGCAIAMFNWVQRRRRGARYPVYTPAAEGHTPTEALDMRPGERVRVRSRQEIERTLNARRRNRGLWFDGEMLRFCGGSYRVGARVTRLIEEQTGKLIELGTPCLVLDGVRASGEYLGFCAQHEAIFWREIWLERLPTPSAPPSRNAPHASAAR